MTTAPLSPERLAEIETSYQRQANALAVNHPVYLQERSDHRAIGELLAEVRRLTALCNESAESYCRALDRARERYDALSASDANVREDLAETSLALKQQDRDLERLCAEVAHWREARRVAVEACEVLVRQRDEFGARICRDALDLGAANQRIAALETGLREACNWIADRSPDGSILVDRLRALADGVQSSKETT
jgi:chromosome segregation ATPase